MSKSIDTLVEDIYGLFESPQELAQHIADEVGKEIGETLIYRLKTDSEDREFTLRMSNLGKPDRQLWYEKYLKGTKESLPPDTLIKFLFGDIWESIILGLAEAAGHEVTQKQAEVELNGIVGHNDAIIDGVVVDVKTASKYAFMKFEKGTLHEDDPFGYMEQLAGYCEAHGGLDGAFLVVEKTLGKLCLLRYSWQDDLKPLRMKERIDHLREVLDDPENIPERCYDPIEEGKAGNLALNINCSYCPFKQNCWSDANGGMGLRTFLYSNGPKHFVHVEKEPRVMEITF